MTENENHFRIFAHGKDFDPDAYLAQSSLQFDRVWQRGTPWGSEFLTTEGQENRTTSGIEKFLGDGRTLDHAEQDLTAAEFLELNESELRRLAKFPGVDHCALILQVRTEVDRTTTYGLILDMSWRLMHFALKTGFQPKFYIDLGLVDDWDDCEAR